MRGHALAAEICERGERKEEALMESDPVRGKTIRWTYEDGPMAGKSFEHSFRSDGTVTWRETGAEKTPKQRMASGRPARDKSTARRSTRSPRSTTRSTQSR